MRALDLINTFQIEVPWGPKVLQRYEGGGRGTLIGNLHRWGFGVSIPISLIAELHIRLLHKKILLLVTSELDDF